MTSPTSPNGAMLYTQGFGSRPENVEIPILQNRAPTAQDTQKGFFPIGKRWIDELNNAEYVLTSYSTVAGPLTANWIFLGSAAGSLTAVAGTTDQITSTTLAGTATLTLPATVVAPGSVAASTTLTATLGNITATNGNIVRGTAGNKDVYSSVATTIVAGANSAGTVTLAAGEAVVATTAVTANSIIRLYRQGIGATGAAALGYVTLFAISAGVSFTIRAVQPATATTAQATDVSVIAWEIVN